MTDVIDPMASRKNSVSISGPPQGSSETAVEAKTGTPDVVGPRPDAGPAIGRDPAAGPGHTAAPGPGAVPAGEPDDLGDETVVGPDEIEEPDEYDDATWEALRSERRPIPEVPGNEILARAVAALLTGYRRYHRLTQRELAARMGADQGEISRLERGQRTPSLKMLARIAAETGSRFTIDVEGPAGNVGAARHATAATFGGSRATVTVLGPTASLRPRRQAEEVRLGPWSSVDLVGSRA